MSTLGEVSESMARLAQKKHEPQGALGSRKFDTAYVVSEGDRVRSFARASLRELGFTNPPRWSEVVRRVRRLGRICSTADAEKLQAQPHELADVFRPVMRPCDGQIAVCHGGGILLHSVQPPHHRLILDVEVVFEKVA